MKSTRPFITNVLVGFGGGGATIVANLILIRILINDFGLATFAAYSLCLVISASLTVLDMGVGVTIIREIGRLRLTDIGQVLKITKSYEIIYLFIAVLLITVAMSSLGQYLISVVTNDSFSDSFSKSTINHIWMLVAARWPVSFYSNALAGFESFKKVNLLRTFHAFSLVLTTIIAVSVFDVSFEILLELHILVGILYVFALRHALIRKFPSRTGMGFSFDLSCITGTYQFASGAIFAGALSAAFINYDKFLATFFMDLKTFGQYSIVTYIILSIVQVVYPISGVLYSRISNSLGEISENNNDYFFRYSLRIVALGISFVAIIISLTGERALMIWLANGLVISSILPSLPFVIIGMFMYGIQTIPASFILSNGAYIFLIGIRLMLLAVHTAICYFAFQLFGWEGFVMSWAISYCFTSIALMSYASRYVQSSLLSLLRCILAPFMTTLFAVFIVLSSGKYYFYDYNYLLVLIAITSLICLTLIFDHLINGAHLIVFDVKS